MNIKEAINFLDKQVPNPSKGLPEEVFFYVSRMTPLVNVDLLIKDEKGRALLAWRDDKYCGKGWHVLGGIVRLKETIETRIKKVAESEIGINVSFDPAPLAVHQFIDPKQDTRSHFVSILYKCFLSSEFIPKNTGLSKKDPGYLMWHESCPQNFLKKQEIYKKYINNHE